jgi:hypothetical protein
MASSDDDVEVVWELSMTQVKALSAAVLFTLGESSFPGRAWWAELQDQLPVLRELLPHLMQAPHLMPEVYVEP